MTALLRIVGLVSSVALLCAAAPKPGDYVAFVACPIVRDTPERPCFLTRHNGVQYYLGVQSGRTYTTTFWPPQLKHKMLVEAYVADGPNICGGKPLERMQISVLPEFSPECNTVLPNAGHPSPPGRAVGADPALKPGQIPIVRDPIPGAPILFVQDDIDNRRPKAFDIFYSFDDDFTQYPVQQNRVFQAQKYAKAIKASAIKVVVLRGATRLDNNSVIVEDPLVLARRQDAILSILRAYDVATPITTEVRSEPETASGERDYANRRVVIEVTP